MSLFFKSGSKSTDFTSDLPPGGTADAPSPLAPSSISPSTVAESIEEGLTYATPWPNNTYIIVEKGSGQAISLNGGALELYDFSDHEDVNIQWLCVERQGYFGFFNTKSGVYLGHNSKETIQASATAFEDWEVVTPRHHPDGGYQLLSPLWWHTLMVIVVAEDGKSLVRRPHGTTLWEFIKV